MPTGYLISFGWTKPHTIRLRERVLLESSLLALLSPPAVMDPVDRLQIQATALQHSFVTIGSCSGQRAITEDTMNFSSHLMSSTRSTTVSSVVNLYSSSSSHFANPLQAPLQLLLAILSTLVSPTLLSRRALTIWREPMARLWQRADTLRAARCSVGRRPQRI